MAEPEVRDRRHGPAVIPVGLVVLGLTSYLFLTVAARGLEPDDYARLAVFWSLTFIIAAGAMAPLEIEGTRAVSAAATADAPPWPAAAAVGRVATGLVIAAALLLAALASWLADELFDGEVGYVALLGGVTAAFAVIYWGRGAMAGLGRFGTYTTVLGGEGVLRLLLLAGAIAAGFASGLAAASTVVLAAVVAAGVSAAFLGRLRRQARRASTSRPAVTANLASLLIASLASQALINAGPLTMEWLTDDARLTGALLSAFVLVRAPVMFISALQAGMIPKLVAALGADDSAGFDALLRRALSGILGVGALLVAGAALLGPFITEVFFGATYVIGGGDMAVLMASSIAFVVAATLQAALVALDRHRIVAAAWVGGLFLYGAALQVPAGALVRVEIASLVSMVGAALLLWAGALWSMRRHAAAGSIA